MLVAAQASGCAAPGYFAIPSVEVNEVYDDNLYYASTNRQSDLITRVSPELEAGYESDTLSFSGSYRFDAEAYASESDLNDAMVRQLADVDVEYLPTSRLTLSAGADYTKTDTPVDLAIIPGGTIPGLLVGRAEAERTAVDAAGSYRMTALTTGSLAVAHTRDELEDSGESDTSVLETWIEQRLSEVNTLSYGYLYRQYKFDELDNDGGTSPGLTPGTRQDSSTPWIGLTHQFNARTRVVARAGPRIDGSSVDPYVLVSLQHRYSQGQVLLDYERDETTLLGEPTKLDLESLYATVSRRFESGLEVQLTPGYARLSQATSSVDIYSLGVGAVYKINEAIFLTTSYEFNLQKVSSAGGGSSDVSRNVFQVGVRFTFPRREPRESW